jgi:hypothetical protein
MEIFGFHLKPVDYLIIAATLLISFLGAYFAGIGLISSSMVSFLTEWIPKATIIMIIIGIGFSYLARDLWGGQIARRLEVIGTGFLIYALIWWPHKEMWHSAGEPAWLAISPGAWQTGFHLMTVTAFGVVSYGFYLFSNIGGEA